MRSCIFLSSCALFVRRLICTIMSLCRSNYPSTSTVINVASSVADEEEVLPSCRSRPLLRPAAVIMTSTRTPYEEKTALFLIGCKKLSAIDRVSVNSHNDLFSSVNCPCVLRIQLYRVSFTSFHTSVTKDDTWQY